MSMEENKAIVRRYVEEIWNQGDFAVAEQLLAPTFVLHNPAFADLPQGPAGFKQVLTLYRSAFPDLQFTIEALLAEGEQVVNRWTARGTQHGELLGIPPTGKPVTFWGLTLHRLANGRIVEEWPAFDQFSLFQQLGASPTAGPATR
jgi:steroid delta-isomerase-like uncharacterized protein